MRGEIAQVVRPRVVDAPGQCPRCQRDMPTYLRFMQRFDTRHWFKCDQCDYIFTTATALVRQIGGAPR